MFGNAALMLRPLRKGVFDATRFTRFYLYGRMRFSMGLAGSWWPTVLGGMLLLLSLSPGIISAAGESKSSQQVSARTPAPGTAERRLILDTLRAEILRWHGLEVVFVVTHLKVKNGWAWAHTRPRSRDGLNHYEDIAALLREESGTWRVLELSAGDDDSVRRHFPDAPTELFPPH